MRLTKKEKRSKTKYEGGITNNVNERVNERKSRKNERNEYRGRNEN